MKKVIKDWFKNKKAKDLVEIKDKPQKTVKELKDKDIADVVAEFKAGVRSFGAVSRKLGIDKQDVKDIYTAMINKVYELSK